MGMIAAPTVVRTPQKGRYHSPKQMNTSSKEEENITDPRFSSNTTKKYRTKTSKGSVIHSNFKINQNSLQKVSMKKDKKLRDNSDYLHSSNSFMGKDSKYQSHIAAMPEANPIQKKLNFESHQMPQRLHFNIDHFSHGHTLSYN